MPEGQETIQIPEAAEQIISSPVQVEANSLSTLKIKTLNINGIPEEWHLLKGGMKQDKKQTSTEQPEKDIKYEVLYNPETNTWLKTLPFEGIGLSKFDSATERLRRSFSYQKKAFEVAGLPELSDQIHEVEVERDGKTVYGFTMPHIGPSLEHIINALIEGGSPTDLPAEVVDLVKNVYPLVADMAEKLYLQYGIWTSDPNPGNILLRKDEKGVHAVLIDFISNQQEQEYLFDSFPQRTYSDQGYQDKLKSMLGFRIKSLHQRFASILKKYGIPFERDPKQVRANIENSATLRNVRARLNPSSTAE